MYIICQFFIFELLPFHKKSFQIKQYFILQLIIIIWHYLQ